MDKYGEKFCAALKQYFEKKYEGRRGAMREFAALIGVSYSQTANMLRGAKGSTEGRRRRIAEKLGLNYDEMIGVSVSDQPPDIEAALEQEPVSATIPEPDLNPIQISAPYEPVRALLNMAREVLESESHWAESLANTIKSFHKGVVADRSDRRKRDIPDQIPKSGDRRKKVVG